MQQTQTVKHTTLKRRLLLARGINLCCSFNQGAQRTTNKDTLIARTWWVNQFLTGEMWFLHDGPMMTQCFLLAFRSPASKVTGDGLETLPTLAMRKRDCTESCALFVFIPSLFLKFFFQTQHATSPVWRCLAASLTGLSCTLWVSRGLHAGPTE